MAEAKKQNFSTLLWILLVASLAATTYLLIDHSQKNKKIEQQVASLTETEQLKSELEKQYYEALSDLEEMRGNNSELNQMIESQKEELKVQKDKIAGLIKNGSDLKSARAELSKLREQAEQYIAQIEQLTADNATLTAQNENLSRENSDLSTAYENERLNNDELQTAKAALMSEKETLSKENADLSSKVNVASVIDVDKIMVKGIMVKESGKQREKARANKVNQLSICFTAEENKVSEPGIEQFFIRIINPTGETMAFENFGSGIMVNQATGDQVPYTHIKGLQYNNEEANACLDWAPNIDFQPGDYKIEIFNKGFLAGSAEFTLK